MKTVFNVNYFDEDDNLIDSTQIDENNEELAWQLFKEFGHEKKEGFRLEFDEATVMEWVGVQEYTPNEHEDVLVYYYSDKKSKSFPNLQFMKESSFYDGKFECKEEVTHWAKLPNPPVT